MTKIRKDTLSFIPQLINFLNPLKKAEYYMKERFNKNNKFVKKYGTFGLSEKDMSKFTFQLSGGMARRVLIYNAIMNDKEIIIADEPTPGLNNKLADEILDTLKDMAKNGKSILLVTHDIDLIMRIADGISVFYGGKIIETINAEDFISGKLSHPYTKAIYDSLPQNGFKNINLSNIEQECKAKGLLFERREIKC